MRRLFGFLPAAAVLAFLAPAARAEMTIAVVAETGAADLAPIMAGLREIAGEGGRVTVYRLPGGDVINPIDRGRLLARVQSADLIVTIADRATEFILAEREKVPVYFVGAASLVGGPALSSPDVGGILPYNVEASLALAEALGLAPVGLAYTPGFGRIADQIEAAARVRGLAVIRRSIGSRKGVGPAVRDLMREARSVWVLGDPLLTRGAGFDFLIEQSLAANVPVVAPGRREVERGALVAFEPEWGALAQDAVRLVRARLDTGAGTETPRVSSGPGAGAFLVNRVLGAKLNPAMPAGTKWRSVP